MYEEDFVKEDLIEFDIDGRKFKYKPITAGQENEWLNEYMYIEKGELVQNLSKLNEVKIRNLVEVPYGPEIIQHLMKFKEPKEWSLLNHTEKWDVLKKLKPGVLSQIIQKINEIDNPVKKKK